DGPQLAAVPERLEVGRPPGLPRAEGVQALVLLLRHRLRVGVDRVRRFGQGLGFGRGFERRARRRLVKNLVELGVNAKRRRGGGDVGVGVELLGHSSLSQFSLTGVREARRTRRPSTGGVYAGLARPHFLFAFEAEEATSP